MAKPAKKVIEVSETPTEGVTAMPATAKKVRAPLAKKTTTPATPALTAIVGGADETATPVAEALQDTRMLEEATPVVHTPEVPKTAHVQKVHRPSPFAHLPVVDVSNDFARFSFMAPVFKGVKSNGGWVCNFGAEVRIIKEAKRHELELCCGYCGTKMTPIGSKGRAPRDKHGDFVNMKRDVVAQHGKGKPFVAPTPNAWASLKEVDKDASGKRQFLIDGKTPLIQPMKVACYECAAEREVQRHRLFLIEVEKVGEREANWRSECSRFNPANWRIFHPYSSFLARRIPVEVRVQKAQVIREDLAELGVIDDLNKHFGGAHRR